MGEQRTHKSRQVVDYVLANADRPLTVDEVAKALDWGISSTSTTLSRMLQDYPNNMRRPRRGVYIWHSEGQSEPESTRSAYMVSVIRRKDDGTMLVRDMDDETALYVMRPFDF